MQEREPGIEDIRIRLLGLPRPEYMAVIAGLVSIMCIMINATADRQFNMGAGAASCAALIAGVLVYRFYGHPDTVRGLELSAGKTLQWSTRRKRRAINVAEITALKLWVTACSPPGSSDPIVFQSASIHHRSGVIFMEHINAREWREVEQLFDALRVAVPDLVLQRMKTPYDRSMEIMSYGA